MHPATGRIEKAKQEMMQQGQKQQQEEGKKREETQQKKSQQDENRQEARIQTPNVTDTFRTDRVQRLAALANETASSNESKKEPSNPSKVEGSAQQSIISLFRLANANGKLQQENKQQQKEQQDAGLSRESGTDAPSPGYVQKSDNSAPSASAKRDEQASANAGKVNVQDALAQPQAVNEVQGGSTGKSRAGQRKRRELRFRKMFSDPTESDQQPAETQHRAKTQHRGKTQHRAKSQHRGKAQHGARRPRPTPRRKSAAKARTTYFSRESKLIQYIEANKLQVDNLDLPQPRVPGLQYDLDRVLFNPGVYQLQDLRTRVYNFDPYLEHIMPVEEFDFNSLKEYKTSSRDTLLSDLAKSHNKRYVGSTSSMTGTLAHFHYLLSNWRDLDLSGMSRKFPEELATFTNLNKVPNAIFLRYRPDSGTYAIDVDKEHDTPNVLMMLGKCMELLLTKPKDEFERHRKGVEKPITEAERALPESYQYTTMGDFLMRSQLDAHDPRLPESGMFDLKTRAVLSVRMNSQDYEDMSGYEIQTTQGQFESYERELYDMMRSTLLKYSLQVRMGRMDGIFLAFHNVRRVFGFQYIPVHEMDKALHGQVDRSLGDHEFKVSLELLNKILDKATAKFPEQSLRMQFFTDKETETRPTQMTICAEPIGEEEIERIQATSKAKVEEFERRIMDAGTDKEAAEGVSDEAAAVIAENSDRTETSQESGKSEDVEPAEAVGSQESSSEITEKHTPPSNTLENAHIDRAGDEVDPSGGPKPIATDAKAESRPPVFVANLMVENQVRHGRSSDWKATQSNRPTKLNANHEWKVNYILKEVERPMGALWNLCDDIKKKRKRVFDKLRQSEIVAEQGDVKKEDYYIKLMRELAKDGRKFRKRMDALDRGKDKIVFGSRQGEFRERINSTEDYMEWMYKQ